MDNATERRNRTRVNNDLHKLPIYHDGLPLSEIDNILGRHGFNALEPAIYCGASGSCTDKVGPNTYLALSWYKMESGRYEVTAYVS